MDIRLDRALRKRMFTGEDVYSLVLTTSGLYFIRTGDSNALKNVLSGDPSTTASRAMLTNEARLASVPLSELAKELGNLYLAIPEIQGVKLMEDDDKRPQTLLIYTSEGDFSFDVTLVPAARVRALVKALTPDES
jgi:hypothetical protein